MVHKRIPWHIIRAIHRRIRQTFFQKSIPVERPFVLAHADISDVRKKLGSRSYAPNWEFSYNYHGEDLNLANVVYYESDEYDVVWWQTHVRGWDVDTIQGTVLHAHWEPEPTEHPKPHLEGLGHSNSVGTENLKDDLKMADTTYGDFEWTDSQLEQV